FRALLLVTVVTAVGSAAGGRRGRWPAEALRPVPACCVTRVPLCPVMPKLHIETIRAPTMIMASSGLYLAVSGHDHETVRSEGGSLSSWHCSRRESWHTRPGRWARAFGAAGRRAPGGGG